MNVKKLNDNAKVIERQTEGAAGYDISACLNSPITIKPGETSLIGSGIAIELPKGSVGLVYVRSSIGVKRSLCLANGTGVIDEDYRGELLVALHNYGATPQIIENGDRIAQLVITPYIAEDICIVDELSDTVRGSGCLGSTGKI